MPKKTKKQTNSKNSKSQNPVQMMARKAAVSQRLKAVKRQASKIEPTDIAKGAAAISIAAGMIAAGAALMDKENRKKVGKTATKGMKFAQEMAADMAEEAGGKYQAVAQSVPIKRSSQKSSAKGRSKKR